MSQKRIVIKVGTNVLTDDSGQLDLPVIRHLVKQIAQIKEVGWTPVLVSSGAVAAGRAIVKDYEGPDDAEKRQVLSSVGQAHLMRIYHDLFLAHNMVCSQVLATREDFIGLEHYKNMLVCFEGLLKREIIPIVNENDVVSLYELMFTDNDELAGLTARMVKADKLILLTDVEGFYNGAPTRSDTSVIPEINVQEESVEDYISEEGSSQGRGGMASKYNIAKRVVEAGIETHIASGKRVDVIMKIINGEKEGTKFVLTE